MIAERLICYEKRILCPKGLFKNPSWSRIDFEKGEIGKTEYRAFMVLPHFKIVIGNCNSSRFSALRQVRLIRFLDMKRIDTHFTAEIAVSASGLMAPPFFIVQGKRSTSSWFEPLPRYSWGSMASEIIQAFTRHLNTFLRKFLPTSISYTRRTVGAEEGYKAVKEVDHALS